jgi:hypothetical protein
MAFSSWTTLKSSILDAIADHVAGKPCTGEYEIEGHRMKYRSFDELQRLYEFASKQAARESRTRRSFGRFRRFQ